MKQASGKIFTIFDYSPARLCLFNTLWRNEALLQDHNTCILPCNSAFCELVPTHNSLWNDSYSPKAIRLDIEAQFKQLAEFVKNGQNVLVFANPMRKRQLEFFRAAFEKYVPPSTISSLIILGLPVALMESHFREFPLSDAKAANQLLAQLNELAALIGQWKKMAGVGECKILLNPQETFNQPYPQSLAFELAAFLECELQQPSLPCHPALFRSHTTRRLLSALEVRENAWPVLDKEDICRSILLFDASLPEDFHSPLAIRQACANAPLKRIFSEVCGVSPEIFSVSDRFLSKEAINPSTPLPEASINSFISRLSPESRKALKQRFKNDELLLSQDQKLLLKGLEAREDSSFQNLAEGEEQPEVTVLTMTYNQASFIRDCLDSVLAQKTTFPVRHLVLDHHSSDGTAEIVADYAARYPHIRPVLLSQRRPMENLTGLLERCRSKYAILCDGDDYFTDPAKLQIQVEMLEKMPHLSFCFHPVVAVYEDNSPSQIFPPLFRLPERENREYELADLASGNFIQTNSVLYRWRFREGLPAWFRKDVCMGDWYLHMLHAEKGKYAYIPRIMSAYRRHSQALFAAARVSQCELRRKTGFAELRTFKISWQHFDARYKKEFEALAIKVFEDFEEIAKIDGDSSLLEHGIELFPEFAKLYQEKKKKDKEAC